MVGEGCCVNEARQYFEQVKGGMITSRSVKCVESMCPQHLQRSPIFLVVNAPLLGTMVIVLFRSAALEDARADLGLAFFFLGLSPLLPTVALLRPTWTSEGENEEIEGDMSFERGGRRGQGYKVAAQSPRSQMENLSTETSMKHSEQDRVAQGFGRPSFAGNGSRGPPHPTRGMVGVAIHFRPNSCRDTW
jgi:hypothetical protein